MTHDENDANEQATDPQAKEVFAAAVKRSGLGKVAEAEGPSGTAIIAAIGGVRGLIESVLPSFVFLVVYLATKDVVLSTLIPFGVSVVFIAVRAITRLPISPAITGAIGVGITAALAILTNRAENNFVPGMLINAVFLIAMLVSIVVRRPLVGLLVAVLLGERAENWRTERARFRTLLLVTWLWVAMFALRLVVEVPLYLAQSPDGLAIAKLILGVPLYAGVLWISWLLVRGVFPPVHDTDDSTPKVS